MHAEICKTIAQAVRNFVVEEGKKPVAAIHQSDFDAESHKNGGILAADDPAANHGKTLRDAVHLEKRVRVESVNVIEGNFCRAMRLRARGDEDHISLQAARSIRRRDGKRVTVFKGCLTANKFNFVQGEILQNPQALHLHHFSFVVHEVMHSKILFQRVIDAEATLLQAGKIERRFA